jgi:DNA-binding beta-propeller fold protein YncE
VSGRIDHLAIDVAGQRLFVAALGNNSLEVVDLKNSRRIHTVRGLAEPQGIAYVPALSRVFVANGGDGTVRGYDAASWKLIQSVAYGDDADNLRIDVATGHLWVGYGAGALGEFDTDGRKLDDIKLGSHPESFQLEKNGSRVFVNLPKSRKIGVVDRSRRSLVASWDTGGALNNYPMALDESGHRLFVVTRNPATLIVLDTHDGKRIASVPVAGDCDDVFLDQRRKRIYAIGGEGVISVLDSERYKELGRMSTVPGARTGLFSPDLDRLFVAVRKNGSHPAEVRVYTPMQ